MLEVNRKEEVKVTTRLMENIGTAPKPLASLADVAILLQLTQPNTTYG